MASDFTPALQEMVDRIRFYTNEASVNAKYRDADLWKLINMCAAQVMTDIINTQENPITVRHRITFVTNVFEYALPPYVGEILRLGNFDETNNVWTGYFEPRSRWNPLGAGIEFLGQSLIRFTGGAISADDTFDVEFIPNGELMPYGVSGQPTAVPPEAIFSEAAGTWADDNMKISVAPDLGVFDRRPNAYVGQVLRVYDGPIAYLGDDPGSKPFFPISEHVITAYDADTVALTVTPKWPTWWEDAEASDKWAYEIVPVFGKSFVDAVILRVVLFITQMELPERAGNANMEFQKAKRNILIRWSQFQAVTGRNFQKDVAGHFDWSLL